MGCNISKSGITRDLEAMRQAGIGGATLFSLADTVTPWAGFIGKSPTPDIITFSEPWWAMVRHAALEARRLSLELTLHNCAGYESSGGPWITPELSMQEVVWSEERIAGPGTFTGTLKRATVDPHPHAQFPNVYIPALGKVGIPVVPGRQNYYRDIAVLALPATGMPAKQEILDLTSAMATDGSFQWSAPPGDWIVYRVGHTTTGAMIQPAQWEAMGLECDKMSAEAVTYHVEHVLAGIKRHLSDLMGVSLACLYFDSYEAGNPTWTPRMPEEFKNRRGYGITPWLPVLAGRILHSEEETARFKQDFKQTIHDLHRDFYWGTAARLTRAAGLRFSAEPYQGPWEIAEVVKYLDPPTTEFWTNDNKYFPQFVQPVCDAAHALGKNIVAAEAFTSQPSLSHWTEHPAWLKPIGDAAFCAGINRLNLHHFVHQPWDDKYQPGNAMGQWGAHFGRYQTWWKPGRAWIQYLWRCQGLLQRGSYMQNGSQTDVTFDSPNAALQLQSIHRRDGDMDIYFVANVASTSGTVRCSFLARNRQPELFDPVWNSLRNLEEFESKDNRTEFLIDFAPSQSFFVIFRKPAKTTTKARPNFPVRAAQAEIDGPWAVSFDPDWGGPKSVTFDRLEDWTSRKEPGIKYYSGTAVYRKTILISAPGRQRLYLDLGAVRHLAEITLNGKTLGVVWTAPWEIDITNAVAPGKNDLEIAVTNVWANRLIGDEQLPPDCAWLPSTEKTGEFLKEFPDWFLQRTKRNSASRYTFTTWNYFTQDSPLEPSGLLGPVKLWAENELPPGGTVKLSR